MEAQIAILLLIVPGYIARKIYKHTNDVRDDLSTFEETLYCLMYSGIISLLAIVILIGWFVPFDSILELSIFDLKDIFTKLTFVALYMCVVLVLSILTGIGIYRLNAWYTYIINKIRGKDKTSVVLNKSIFDTYFNDGKYQHYVDVYKDDKFIGRGRIKNSVEKYKELGLEPCEAKLEALRKRFDEDEIELYKNIYYDSKSGLLIKEYNVDIPVDYQ